MEENNLNSSEEVIDIIDLPVEKVEEPRIVQTDIGSKDGQTKCPKCGSTDISLNVNNGHLRCNFCRHEFEPEKVVGLETDLYNLKGQVFASGTQDIEADSKDVVTFKCSSCGAEVIINTASSTQARCHWCRNMLSINQQIKNGSIPDVLLPFQVSKEEAKKEIERFVGKRKFYAHPKFKAEFTTQNIMGVYFPYMIVDVNAHANYAGQGEHQVRSYTEGSGDNQRRYYDADLYSIEREFDLVINGLTVESNSDKLNSKSSDKTNNIINAIMPFDIENCVKYDSNYLNGFTSEKRDVNIEQLKTIVETQSKDIARFTGNKTLKYYDRGVAWKTEEFEVKGQQWKAAYLPIWLYSYQQVKGNKKKLHYVAVNARTKETMGSVPIHMPKLIFISFLVELLGILLVAFVDFDKNWIFLIPGVVYFAVQFTKYRNSNARHTYELETKTEMSNVREFDVMVDTKRKLSSPRMFGSNNKIVHGKGKTSEVVDKLISGTELGKFLGK